MPIVELTDRALRPGASPLSMPPPPRAAVAATGASSAYVNISEEARRAVLDARPDTLARAATSSLVANGPVTTELLARLAVSRSDARGTDASSDTPLTVRRTPPPPPRVVGDERAQSIAPRFYDDLAPVLLPLSPLGIDPVVAFTQLAASAGYYALRPMAMAPDPDAWRDAESPVRLAYTKHERYVPPRGTRVSVYA